MTCRRVDRREQLEHRKCQCASPVPVLTQIAWNLEDRRARYLMLITEDSQALPLLFSTGLAHSETSTVIFGSEFQEDRSDAATLRHLQRVQGSMRLGTLLILVHCRRIYENLLDMTNQHHLEEHGRRYTRLSMQAHSRYFPVHENFRCVILGERSDLRSLPPPFLNRFEKAVLTLETVIQDSHQEDHRRLEEMLRVRSASVDKDFWSEVLPGNRSEILRSLTFACSGVSENADDRVRCAMFRAASAAKFVPLLRMRCSAFDQITEACKHVEFAQALDELFFFYFGVQQHGTMRAVVEHAVQHKETRNSQNGNCYRLPTAHMEKHLQNKSRSCRFS